jgi:hypothetical protein
VRRAEYFSLKDVSKDEIPLSNAIISELVFCDRNPDDNGMKRFTSLSAERVEREKVALSRRMRGNLRKGLFAKDVLQKLERIATNILKFLSLSCVLSPDSHSFQKSLDRKPKGRQN